MDKTLVFIDAAFFSILSKHFGKGKYLKTDIVKFSKLISKKMNLFCEHVFYYTSPPFHSENPSEEQIKRKKGYDNFVESFCKNKNVTIREGRCQRVFDKDGISRYCQKGVDALMVSDMVSVPIKFEHIKKIIIVTSDTDFCPIIDDIEKMRVNVLLYTYYEKKRKTQFSVSHHLIDSCKFVNYLSREDFEKARLEK